MHNTPTFCFVAFPVSALCELSVLDASQATDLLVATCDLYCRCTILKKERLQLYSEQALPPCPFV